MPKVIMTENVNEQGKQNVISPLFLGFGLGLRAPHYKTILETRPKVDWFEAITEDFLVEGGRHRYYLQQIREHYPCVLHGVSLSIGSDDPIDKAYLQKVKALATMIEPAWISDHLCWTGVDGLNMHDLLPLPYTEEALKHLVPRIQQVQDYLGRQILLENVSSYIEYHDSMLTEWEFLAEVAERADCLILLDINNIYVSSINHHFDPKKYLDGIPISRVRQFHLAGHKRCGDYIIDTHDAPLIEAVWSLYAQAVQRFGKVSTMIERDDNIPELAELLNELQQARQIAQSIWRKVDVVTL